MAKVTEKENKSSDTIEVEYSLWPLSNSAIATLVEWENGEGFDIYLQNVKFELTHCEASAIVALVGMANCKL
jgi:hypothetical protein